MGQGTAERRVGRAGGLDRRGEGGIGLLIGAEHPGGQRAIGACARSAAVNAVLAMEVVVGVAMDRAMQAGGMPRRCGVRVGGVRFVTGFAGLGAHGHGMTGHGVRPGPMGRVGAHAYTSLKHGQSSEKSGQPRHRREQ